MFIVAKICLIIKFKLNLFTNTWFNNTNTIIIGKKKNR